MKWGKLHCYKSLIARKEVVRLKSEQFCQTISVGGILNDTKFNGFSKFIPELSVLPSLLINIRRRLFCIKVILVEV
jgi:hypothetical protein